MLDGADVTDAAPDAMLRAGLALVPEHRRLFANLTVAENLRVGGVTVSASDRAELIDEMVELFPVLGGKFTTAAGYLSGGEAQQLADRAGADEPPEGGADGRAVAGPGAVVGRRGLRPRRPAPRARDGPCSIVEQNATRLLSVADRAYVMRSGEIVLSGSSEELREREDLFDAFVGGTGPLGGLGDG